MLSKVYYLHYGMILKLISIVLFVFHFFLEKESFSGKFLLDYNLFNDDRPYAKKLGVRSFEVFKNEFFKGTDSLED